MKENTMSINDKKDLYLEKEGYYIKPDMVKPTLLTRIKNTIEYIMHPDKNY